MVHGGGGTLLFAGNSDTVEERWHSGGHPTHQGISSSPSAWISPHPASSGPGRHAVLPGERRLRGRGAVEERWHSGGHVAREGTSARDSLARPSSRLTPVGGLLYFIANDCTHGQRAVEERRHHGRHLAGQGSAAPGWRAATWAGLGAPQGTLVFTVMENAARHELWKTGRHRGGHGAPPGRGARLHHLAGSAWGQRSTSAGTPPVRCRCPSCGKTDGTRRRAPVHVARGFPGRLEHMTAMGETLYFLIRMADGRQALWRSDGTEAGTVQAAVIATLTTNVRTVGWPWDGLLFFVTERDELWRSDGTQAGTLFVSPASSRAGAAWVPGASRPWARRSTSRGMTAPPGMSRSCTPWRPLPLPRPCHPPGDGCEAVAGPPGLRRRRRRASPRRPR